MDAVAAWEVVEEHCVLLEWGGEGEDEGFYEEAALIEVGLQVERIWERNAEGG